MSCVHREVEPPQAQRRDRRIVAAVSITPGLDERSSEGSEESLDKEDADRDDPSSRGCHLSRRGLFGCFHDCFRGFDRLAPLLRTERLRRFLRERLKEGNAGPDNRRHPRRDYMTGYVFG